MFEVLLGHLIGDYLLQSRNMALIKSKKTWRGLGWCVFHCLVYTASVCLFLWTAKPLIVVLVFLSHFPIDRWSSAAAWLKIVHGRDIMAAYKSQDKYREIDISFSCLVYAVVDSTMHLVLLWLIVKWVV